MYLFIVWLVTSPLSAIWMHKCVKLLSTVLQHVVCGFTFFKCLITYQTYQTWSIRQGFMELCLTISITQFVLLRKRLTLTNGFATWSVWSVESNLGSWSLHKYPNPNDSAMTTDILLFYHLSWVSDTYFLYIIYIINSNAAAVTADICEHSMIRLEMWHDDQTGFKQANGDSNTCLDLNWLYICQYQSLPDWCRYCY